MIFIPYCLIEGGAIMLHFLCPICEEIRKVELGRMFKDLIVCKECFTFSQKKNYFLPQPNERGE